MRFSHSVDLAIHSLWYMAVEPEKGPIMVKELARAQSVSESYLAKVFQSLAKTDLIRSTRGKHGGYVLSRDPSKISVGAIVRAVEGDGKIFDCAFHERGCGGAYNCGLQELFCVAVDRMYGVLDSVTLGEFIEQAGDELDRSRPWLQFRYENASA